TARTDVTHHSDNLDWSVWVGYLLADDAGPESRVACKLLIYDRNRNSVSYIAITKEAAGKQGDPQRKKGIRTDLMGPRANVYRRACSIRHSDQLVRTTPTRWT